MTAMQDMPCSVPGCGQKHVAALFARHSRQGKSLWLFACQEHTVSEVGAVQWHYLKCRAEGTGHKLAEMFALQQPPMSNTDREFLEGRGGCYDQFQGSPQGEYYRQVAESEGFNPQGKVYLSGLANYPGDPRAWVSGRGDVQRVCEERGFDCDGSVRVRAARHKDMAPAAEGVAPDLVDQHVAAALEADPGLREQRAEDVREAVIERITPAWAKGGSDGS